MKPGLRPAAAAAILCISCTASKELEPEVEPHLILPECAELEAPWEMSSGRDVLDATDHELPDILGFVNVVTGG